MNPGRYREIAGADIQRIGTRDHHGIGAGRERHCLAKRRIDKLCVAVKAAGNIAIQRP